jgi:hypothetical protein
MGKYVNKHLLPGEQVVHETTYHWTHFISWVSFFTLGLYPYIQIHTDEFVVTTRRIIIKKGFIAYYTLEMNLSRVETVNVEQGILGRILCYGYNNWNGRYSGTFQRDKKSSPVSAKFFAEYLKKNVQYVIPHAKERS